MKIVKTASGKNRIKMSKSEWTSIGKKAGWMKSSSDYDDWKTDPEYRGKGKKQTLRDFIDRNSPPPRNEVNYGTELEHYRNRLLWEARGLAIGGNPTIFRERDKEKQRKFREKHGLPDPGFADMTLEEAIEEAKRLRKDIQLS